MLDYDEIERLAMEHKPKMLVGGFSAYSQVIDWERMSQIAKKLELILWLIWLMYQA